MTPAELRGLADRNVADAASLGADAEHLRIQAAALRGVLEPLIVLSRQVWMGPAATEFEQNTRRRGRVLDQQADRLDRIAHELVGRARRLRSEAAALRAQASAAEAAAAGFSGGSPIGTQSGVI
jgi:hypothetical protein